MEKILGRNLAAVCVLCFGSPSPANEASPDFDLWLECPSPLTGLPGSLIQFNGKAVLTTGLAADGSQEGARAWSLSFHATGGARIIAATTDNTAAADFPVGFVFPDGYRKTEVTNDTPENPDNAGVVSAVILSFEEDASLPSIGEALLLVVSVEAPVPVSGEARYDLEFKDGLVGSGQPVKNTITYGEGMTHRDDRGSLDNDTDAYEICTVLVLPGAPFIRGNVNADAVVNITDAVKILDHLFRSGTLPACKQAADLNDDGTLNVSDPVYLLNTLFRGDSPPAPPFPRCGFDSTPDALGCERGACP